MVAVGTGSTPRPLPRQFTRPKRTMASIPAKRLPGCDFEPPGSLVTHGGLFPLTGSPGRHKIKARRQFGGAD